MTILLNLVESAVDAEERVLNPEEGGAGGVSVLRWQSFTMRRHTSSGVSRVVDQSGGGDAGDTRQTTSIAERDQDEDEKKIVAAAATGPRLDTALAGLLILVVVGGCFSILAYKSMNMQFVVPLDSKAPLDRFSHGRAMKHIVVLAGFGRQVQSPALLNFVTGSAVALQDVCIG